MIMRQHITKRWRINRYIVGCKYEKLTEYSTTEEMELIDT